MTDPESRILTANPVEHPCSRDDKGWGAHEAVVEGWDKALKTRAGHAARLKKTGFTARDWGLIFVLLDGIFGARLYEAAPSRNGGDMCGKAMLIIDFVGSLRILFPNVYSFQSQ